MFKYIKHNSIITKTLIVFATILLSCVYTLKAQQYFFQNFNTENGLAQSQPYALAQDKFNRLWVGTLGGLSVFDGSSFVNYSRLNGLPSNVVLSLDFVHDGSAWIGTTEGLSHFNGLKFDNYLISSNLDSNTINQVKVDNRSRVWVLSNNTLYLKSDAGFEKQKFKDDYILSLFKDKSGVIHILYLREGLYKYENDKWVKVLDNNDRLFFDAYFAPNGNLYVLSSKGILKKSNDSIITISAALPALNLGSTNVKMVVDEKENIWLTGIKGVWKYNNNTLHHLTYQNGFTDEQTFNLFVDNYGNVWIASNGSGIYKYAESPFSKFDNKVLPNAKSISSIFRRDNKLILGSYLLGIYEMNLDNYQVQKFTFNGLPNVLTTLHQDEQTGLLVGNLNNFIIWKNGQSHKLTTDVLAFGSVWQNIEDTLWGIINGNLYKIANYKITKMLDSNNFSILSSIENGKILLGSTKNGLLVYDRVKGTTTDIPALKNVRIHTMLTDANRWYLGTDDRGLIVYEPQTGNTISIDQRQGLSCNYVYNILKDKNNNIWIGTGCGIDKIQFDSDGSYQLKSYGKSDGLNGAEANVGASYQDQEGNIWFGTTKGLFRYDGSKEKAVRFAPYVGLVNIQLFSKDIEAKQFSDSLLPFLQIPYQPVFAHNQNSLTFSYKAVCLSAPEKIKYRYQLQGAEKEWVETDQTSVTYNQLSPGRYTFIVYASDENGKWHENAYRYSFTIDAIFYQTIWFKTIVTLIALAGIIYLIYSYSRRKEAQRLREIKLREEEQSKVRHRTAEDFHDEMGNKITRINLLTMMAEKKAKEDESLQQILQQIRQNTSSLYYGSKDIIWALQKESNYLKEALLRIQQNAIALINETEIQLQIEEEPAIKDNILMPMDYGRNLILIFKEAINNAIKYSGANRLTLRFYEDIDNSIVLELEDNGIGFDVDEVGAGNGLKNMKNRANAIKANYSIHSLKGIGTLIRLRMFSYSFGPQ